MLRDHEEEKELAKETEKEWPMRQTKIKMVECPDQLRQPLLRGLRIDHWI